jgi:hypothetical protein
MNTQTATATQTITELRNNASLWVQRNEWKPKHGLGVMPRYIVETYTELWDAGENLRELHEVKSLAQDLFRGLALAHTIRDSVNHPHSAQNPNHWRTVETVYMDSAKLYNACVKFTRKNAVHADVLKAMSEMLSDEIYRPSMTQFYSDGQTLYVTDGFRLAKMHTNKETGYYVLSGSELVKTDLNERALPYQDVINGNMRTALDEHVVRMPILGEYIFATELYLAQNKLVKKYGGILAISNVFDVLTDTEKRMFATIDEACDLVNPCVLFYGRAVNPQYLVDTLRYLVLRSPNDPYVEYVVKIGESYKNGILFTSCGNYVHALLMPKLYDTEQASRFFKVA